MKIDCTRPPAEDALPLGDGLHVYINAAEALDMLLWYLDNIQDRTDGERQFSITLVKALQRERLELRRRDPLATTPVRRSSEERGDMMDGNEHDELVAITHEFIEAVLLFPVNTEETVYARVVNAFGKGAVFALHPDAQRLALRLKRMIEDAEANGY